MCVREDAAGDVLLHVAQEYTKHTRKKGGNEVRGERRKGKGKEKQKQFHKKNESSSTTTITPSSTLPAFIP